MCMVWELGSCKCNIMHAHREKGLMWVRDCKVWGWWCLECLKGVWKDRYDGGGLEMVEHEELGSGFLHVGVCSSQAHHSSL